MTTEEIKEAWEKRLASKAASKVVYKNRVGEKFTYYQRNMEYDPAFCSEIEFHRRIGKPWHNPIITHGTSLNALVFN